MLPDEHLDRKLSTEESQTELLRKSAAALGVATLHDLADYYRMSPRVVAPLVNQMVKAGELRPIDVEGWSDTAYLAPGSRLPRSIEGVSLLSPFDPVVWFRPRAERLFDFHYRIEIYVPAARRRWGYYVLPFRVGDRIVGRVDLKADRKARQLLVLNAHEEDSIDVEHCCNELAGELQALCDWLGLDEVRVERSNRFSVSLAKSVS